MVTDDALGVRRGGHDGWGLRGGGGRRQGGHDGMGTARPAQVRCLTGRAADALGGAGAGGPAVPVRSAGPVLAARGGQHELAGDRAAGGRHRGEPGSPRSSPREVPRVSSAEHERLLRRARMQDAALFRYRLIGPALEKG